MFEDLQFSPVPEKRKSPSGGAISVDLGLQTKYDIISTHPVRFPTLAMISFCQGADVVFQKFVHAGINPPLNYMVAPCSVTPLPARCSGDCYPFPPGATGRAPSFWLPLAGYARSAARPEAPGLKAPLPGRGETTVVASMCRITCS